MKKLTVHTGEVAASRPKMFDALAGKIGLQ